MLQDTLVRKAGMEVLFSPWIRLLIARAALCVLTHYDAKTVDPETPEDGPIDYRFQQRCPRRGTLEMPVDFDFEGIVVWYICHRNGDTFHLRHILVEIAGGRFRRGQVNQFEGYWDEFPQFVAEDRWVKALLTQRLPRAA